MIFLIYFSKLAIPIVVFYFVGMGIASKNNVYEDFVNGAKGGIKIVLEVLPTLIGLMMGVAVLSESGFIAGMLKYANGAFEDINVPVAVVPAIIVRLFSSSAATGIVLDIFKKFGTDSYEGILSSLIMSSTETCFYTMSVYFMAAKVTKSRYTLAGALISTFAGIIASVIIAQKMVY